MKRFLYPAAFLLLMFGTASCSDRKGTDSNAGVTGEQTTQSDDEKPYAVSDLTHTYTAKLAGKTFDIKVARTADRNLPLAVDELGKKYYDNRVDVMISCDGKLFFEKSYTKDSFADFLKDNEQQGTVLLGMAYDSGKSDDHTIRLGAQIGQIGIEEGPAFSVEIPLDGSVSSIVRDHNQDTTGSEVMGD